MTMADIHQMRLDLGDGAGTAEQRARWQVIVDAQAANWVEADAAYDTAIDTVPEADRERTDAALGRFFLGAGNGKRTDH